MALRARMRFIVRGAEREKESAQRANNWTWRLCIVIARARAREGRCAARARLFGIGAARERGCAGVFVRWNLWPLGVGWI